MATLETRCNVSNAQLEALWEFLNSHRDIAMGYNESIETRYHYQRMWEKATLSLNSLDGDIRDWKGWSNYWIEYKARLKKKIATIENLYTEAGSSKDTTLTDVEKKFYDILGNNNGLGTSRMPIDPFSEELFINNNNNNNNNSTMTTYEWMNVNDHSTQTPFQPLGSTSVSTQSIDLEATTSRNYGSHKVKRKTASTETERPVVAATQTVPAAPQASSSAVVVRRRRRASTPYPMETRRSIPVATLAPNGFVTRTNAFGGMLGVLSRMVRALERIEARLNGPQVTGAQ